MIKIQFTFYTNMFNFKNGKNGFYHQTEISELPEENDFFIYSNELFNRMNEEEKEEFEEYNLKKGRYYVGEIRDYTKKDSDIEQIIFLILDE
ncbi:hypothetical protein [Tenacibaculum finnmarkense]|uniref:hypothetical protein n=1 Tax=Tenacibaculum finnmarkense TaxID=2781243 RepID=UPI001E2FB44D|nr:hypothetical protein [Tenacibaculum finnmarkense]MCD8410486.1 hypothetical protein [Tenacibaculum finnmarkense genomovar ulcerans]